MNSLTHRIRELARAKVRARITHQTRSPHGFVVRLNGETVHTCPTHREAVANLIARLQCAPKLIIEVRPAEPDDYKHQRIHR